MVGFYRRDFAPTAAQVIHSACVRSFDEGQGDATVLYAEMNAAGDSFVARFPGSFSAERGARLILSVSPAACHVFDSEGGAHCRRSVPLGAAKN